MSGQTPSWVNTGAYYSKRNDPQMCVLLLLCIVCISNSKIGFSFVCSFDVNTIVASSWHELQIMRGNSIRKLISILHLGMFEVFEWFFFSHFSKVKCLELTKIYGQFTWHISFYKTKDRKIFIFSTVWVWMSHMKTSDTELLLKLIGHVE